MANASLPRRRLRFEARELMLVGVGAVPGALLRWQAGVQLGPWVGGSPGADLLVNLVGSFVLGYLAGPIPRRTGLLLLVGIGFCGSLTTFSSWMLDVIKLIQHQHPLWGLLLVIASLVLGLLSAGLGLWFSRQVWRRRG